MAIQVVGTQVISNARALTNIASIDATTAAAITAGGVGGASPALPAGENLTAGNAVALIGGSLLKTTGYLAGVSDSQIGPTTSTYSSGTQVTCINDPAQSNRIIVLSMGISNAYLTAATFSNGVATGGTIAASGGMGAYGPAGFCNIGYDGAGNYCFLYSDGSSSGYLTSSVFFTVSGNTTTVTSSKTLIPGMNTDSRSNFCAGVATNKFVIFYAKGNASNAIWYRTVTRSGSSQSYSTEYSLGTGDRVLGAWYSAATGKVFWTGYGSYGGGGGMWVASATLNGSNQLTGIAKAFSTVSSGQFEGSPIGYDSVSDSIYAFGMTTINGYNQSAYDVFNGVSTATPSFYRTAYTRDAMGPDLQYVVGVSQSPSSSLGMLWGGSSNAVASKALGTGSSGYPVPNTSIQSLASSVGANQRKNTGGVADNYAIFFFGGGGESQLRYASQRLTTASAFIGLAEETKTTGQSTKFTPFGSINTNQSGLIAGALYTFGSTDGSITAGSSPTLGKAYSSTNIVVTAGGV